MEQRLNRLNSSRAMQLLTNAGSTGVPVRTWSRSGSGHAGRAILKSVSGDTATILPLPGHKKLENVPVSSLSTWKAGLAAQTSLLYGESHMPTQSSSSAESGQFVVFDSERGLLFSGGIEGTKTRKGFTKRVEEAKLFDSIANAKRCAGHLANNPNWSGVLGEDFRLEVSTLEEYKRKRPYPFNEPPNPNKTRIVETEPAPSPKPAPSPAVVHEPVEKSPVTIEAKKVVHDIGVRGCIGETPSISAEPHPMLAEMLRQEAATSFKVDDSEFRELQSAYRDLEDAIALTKEARNRVMQSLSRICGKMNVGLAAAGLTNSPS